MTDPPNAERPPTAPDEDPVLSREIAEQAEVDASDLSPSEKAALRDKIRERADDELGVGDRPDTAPS